MESAKMDEFVEGLSLQDYYKLMTKLGERFTKRPKRGPARKPWSQNKHAQLKLKGCVNHAINIAAQGEIKEFLHDLAKQHPKIIQPVQERGDEDRVLENLKCVYHRLQNTSHEADGFRGTVLQCLRGVRGYNELKALGWDISEEQWIKIGKTIEWSQEAKDHDNYRGPVTFEPYLVEHGGAPATSADKLAILRAIVLSESHSRKLSTLYKGTTDPRALTSFAEDIRRELERKGIALASPTVRKYINSKELLPELRAYKQTTDKCDKCLEYNTELKYLRTQCNSTQRSFLETQLNMWLTSLQPEIGRAERVEMDKAVLEIASRRLLDPDKVKQKFKILHAVAQHKHIADVCYKTFDREKNTISATNKKIVAIHDWKQSLIRGHGPVEGSTVIYDVKQTSCHGSCYYFWHARRGAIGKILIATLSDVMNHTAQAEIATEEAALKDVIASGKYPDFAEAWEASGVNLHFHDTGPHYWSYDFLGYKILDLPAKLQKIVGVQFFEFKHGKSTELDAGLFSSTIDHYLTNMVKKERILETSDFVAWFNHSLENQRADNALYDDERRDLHLVHFWQWDPQEPGPPKKVTRLNVVSLRFNRYWEGRPTKFLGQVRASVFIAPISSYHSQFKPNELSAGIHFTRQVHACKETWERSGFVPAPPKTNTNAILEQSAMMKKSHDASQTTLEAADAMIHMNLSRGAAQKRKRAAEGATQRATAKGDQGNQTCAQVQTYTLTSLEETKQVDLRAECTLHGLPSYGDNKALKAVLKAHYNTFSHSHKPGGAAPNRAAEYYNTETPSEQKEACLEAGIERFFTRLPKKI